MLEIQSKLDSVVSALTSNYGFNLEASNSYEIDFVFKNKNIPNDPGKKDGDTFGEGNSKLYWDNKLKVWIPTDVFNATRSSLGELNFNKIDPLSKENLLNDLKNLKYDLAIKEFVSSLSSDFKEYFSEKEDDKKLKKEKEIIKNFNSFFSSIDSEIKKRNEIISKIYKDYGPDFAKKIKRIILRVDDTKEIINILIKQIPIDYTPKKEDSKKDLNKEDLIYLKSIIRKKPDISRGDFVKLVQDKFNPVLIKLIERAWEVYGNPKSFYINFLDDYDKNKTRLKLELSEGQNILLLRKKQIDGISPVVDPIYEFLNKVKKVTEKDKYENSFLGYTEKFLDAVQNYASSPKQYAEIDYAISEILTGINLLDKEGLVKVWKKAKIPKISDLFDRLGEKLSDVLSFKELQIKVPSDSDSVTYEELSQNAYNNLKKVQNAPAYFKNFENLLKKLPKFEYVEIGDTEEKKKTVRKLNKEDLEFIEQIKILIPEKEQKELNDIIFPGMSKEEIKFKREVFKENLEKKEKDKLLKYFWKNDKKQFTDMEDLEKEISKKKSEISEKEKNISENKKIIQKKLKEDVVLDLERKINNLEKKLNKEDDPKNIEEMQKELGIYRKQREKITEDQKKKSEEVQKELDEIQKETKNLSKELKSLKNKRKTQEENNKMYLDLGSWYKGILQKADQAKKYEKSLEFRRSKILKEKERLEKKNKILQDDLKKSTNSNLKEEIKKQVDFNDSEIKFLDKALKELSYDLSPRGEVINLDPKLQEKYFEKFMDDVTSDAIKKFPSLLYEWKEDPEVLNKKKNLEEKIKELEKKEKLEKGDKKLLESYKKVLESLDITLFKKQRVEKSEAIKKIKEIREFFLKPQEVFGDLYIPKKNLITEESYLKYLKDLDAKMEEMEKVREEGLVREKYLKRLYEHIPESESATNRLVPRMSAFVIPQEVKTLKENLTKVYSQFKNYVSLLEDSDVKSPKYENFLENLQKNIRNVSKMFEDLNNNKILEVAKDDKLSIDQKDKIMKKQFDSFMDKYEDSKKEYKRIMKETSDMFNDKNLKEITNLREKTFKIINSLNDRDIPGLNSDDLIKELEKILSKKFDNKEDMEDFLNAKDYDFKSSKNLELGNYLKSIEKEIENHFNKEKLKKEQELDKLKEMMSKGESYIFESNKDTMIKSGSILLNCENNIFTNFEKIASLAPNSFIREEINSVFLKIKEII